MDRSLLEAARDVESGSLKELALSDPDDVLQTTPYGSTCLHIASAHGNQRFCEEVVDRNQSLLAAVNADEETPLLNAVTSGHDSLASFLLRCCREHGLSEAIRKQDKHSGNALHHAVRLGYRELALELIDAEPALSRAVDIHGESPMFIAVMRDLTDVAEKLLEIPDSAHSGAYRSSAMHAAVRRGNKDIAKRIIETRPGLATEEAIIMTHPDVAEEEQKEGEQDNKNVNYRKITPMQLAVRWNRIEVLTVLLEHEPSLGYEVSANGDPLLVTAAFGGHVGIAEEILKHCPDAPYSKADGWTYLHQAVWSDQTEFVKFIVGSQQLRNKLVNMRNSDGKTALHYAVQKCNPIMVSALISHKEVDFTMFDRNHKSAFWKLFDAGCHAKTLNWNEIVIRMMEADPKDAVSISNLSKAVKREVTNASRENVRSLTQIYTSNTSLVAILMATITFAAAFTLPGGYSSDTGSEGLPIMARKFAFQAFLIFDTLAMCSSFSVAFICIIARWEDLEFLLYYRSFTKKLMWFAYMATTIAFATGLYTVLSLRLQWLAITVCLLSVVLPILTKVLGEWPVLKLKIRLVVVKLRRIRLGPASLGPNFKSDFLDMV